MPDRLGMARAMVRLTAPRQTNRKAGSPGGATRVGWPIHSLGTALASTEQLWTSYVVSGAVTSDRALLQSFVDTALAASDVSLALQVLRFR